MLILIEKDSSTRVPREVADIEEARGIAREFPVYVVHDDPSLPPTLLEVGDEPAAEEAPKKAGKAKKA